MIKGENITLRAIEPHDIDLMYNWENDISIWPVSGTLTPFSKQTMIDFLENSKEDIYTAKQLRLAVDKNNSPSDSQPTIGYIDLYDFDPFHRRAGVGILIADKDSRRSGYGLESIELLCEYSFGVLNLHQLFCNVHKNNAPSIQLFTAAGFKNNGELLDWTITNGKWTNVVVMQKINNDKSL